MSNLWGWCQGLGVATFGVIAFSANIAIAEITPDGTLTTNSIINKQGNNRIIEGGTLYQNGSNLFHSFKEFSVPEGSTAEFNNNIGVQNIITRVTGNNGSEIYGTLKAKYTANLFLINPNGIIFGPNASLQIGGSFIASTASSVNFADGTKFSATDPQTTPLLTVSVPTGLQFGATAASIRNQSQAKSPYGISNISTNILGKDVGLQVQPGRTLALVGGEIILDGGNLTAPSGRIELGSVAANSLVSLSPSSQGWSLGYKSVQDFQDIQLIQRPDAEGTIKFLSQVDTSNRSGSGGSIQVRGRTVELSGHVALISQTRSGGDKDGEDLTITTRKLILRDGAQISTSTTSNRKAGNLIVDASDSVDLIGGFTSPRGNFIFSGLSSESDGDGNAGDITINTGRLRIKEGAEISADSSGILQNQLLSPARGNAGNLTVNASDFIEIIGIPESKNLTGLFTSTLGSGNAGQVKISTGKLILRDGATINVRSKYSESGQYEGVKPDLGLAGDLIVNASSILLDNGAKLTSNSESGGGGNITLHVQDLLGLRMRRNSQITTNAGGNGNGGNITIKVPNGFIFAVPSENSDISANAVRGKGGNVEINTLGLIGIQYREKPTNYSDITASSEFGLNGKVQINSPDADPSRGLVELPVNLVDASRQIVADCNSGRKIARSSFIRTGRGGLIADPTQPLIADDAVLADWITLSPESQNHADGIPKRAVVQAQRNTGKKSQKVNSVNEPTQIVEAQGWVIDANGNVVLVDQVPTATPHNSWLNTASCAAN